MIMCYSSYGGCVGMWYQTPRWSVPQPYFAQRIAQQNGAIIYVGYENPLNFGGTVYAGLNRGPVMLAAVTDGTSNTLMYSERAHGMLNDNDAMNWNWWCSGNIGDTSFCTLYPINPFNKTGATQDPSSSSSAFVQAASSYHAGGANFLMCDGSVKFLKDTINTWAFDTSTGYPVGVTPPPPTRTRSSRSPQARRSASTQPSRPSAAGRSSVPTTIDPRRSDEAATGSARDGVTVSGRVARRFTRRLVVVTCPL